MSEIKISVVKCNHCGTESLMLNDYGACPKCGMNWFEVVKEQTVGFPPDIQNLKVERDEFKAASDRKGAALDYMVVNMNTVIKGSVAGDDEKTFLQDMVATAEKSMEGGI